MGRHREQWVDNVGMRILRPAEQSVIGRRAFLSSLAALGSLRVLKGQASLGACAPQNSPEPWSRFRGPNASGIARGSGYPIEFGPTKNVMWKRPFPMGKSSPVLTADRIVLTADVDNRLQVISVDRATGKTVWERSLARARSEFKRALNHGASSSAAIEGTNVYAFFGDYGIVSFHANGKERWKTPLGPFSSLWGMATSPVIAGDTVVLLLEGIVHSSIAGFDRNSGRKKWEVERPPFALNYSTPILRSGSDNRCEVLALGPNELVAYDPGNGERRWSTKVLPGSIVASPTLGDDDTLVSMIFPSENGRAFPDKDGDGIVTAAEISALSNDPQITRVEHMIADETGNRDGKITQEEWNLFWRTQQGRPAIIATSIGAPGEAAPNRGTRWSYSKGVARVATPLIYGGIVYFINMGGILTALNAMTGEPLKVARLQCALENYYASPVAASGVVYFTSETGKVVAVRAGADWSVLACNDLDEPCYATPALSEGRIFVRTSQSLYCFGKLP
jgi:outer membrane protein assembly factor BamB